MSKTKLALLVFCIAFGLNGIAFLTSKKTFTVDEVKNVWLYELPLTASPLDSYVALAIGPHQGVVGTLFSPNSDQSNSGAALEPLLAETFKWDAPSKTLLLKLKAGATYSNGEPITTQDWVRSHVFLASKLKTRAIPKEWTAWRDSVYQDVGGDLAIHFSKESREFDLEQLLSLVLTHPLTGVIHAQNQEALEAGKTLKKEWISSGPYKIWKWNPKEIELAGRSDFPGGMRKDFFRKIKFQSAPVKNPSCDFMQGRKADEKMLNEHTVQPSDSTVHVFWICRSFQQEGFCKDFKRREVLASLLQGREQAVAGKLLGQTLRYRIPYGSDEFREQIKSKIKQTVEASGGVAVETCYFFKNSIDTDIELLFVEVPKMEGASDFALSLALLSSRLGPSAINEGNLAGEIMEFPVQLYLKHLKGGAFKKLFIEPDLDEKKLPL